MMPRDVRTRWNSTFAMFSFALRYRKPVDIICDSRSLGLSKYALDDDEWLIVEQLTAVLGVSLSFLFTTQLLT